MNKIWCHFVIVNQINKNDNVPVSDADICYLSSCKQIDKNDNFVPPNVLTLPNFTFCSNFQHFQ